MKSSAANGGVQNLFVMRHGERMDDAEPTWVAKAARPWDPPLTEKGHLQAQEKGEKLRSEGLLVTRILVSPFLRCVQTTAGVIKGMYPDGTANSNLKVSIEYGLAELMNNRAIRNPPKGVIETADVPWILPLEELYALLPSGVLDTSVQPTIPKVPAWGESTEDGHRRFSNTFFSVADKFSSENVLCVSHGEGVAVSYMHLKPEFHIYGVEYCSYTHAQRKVLSHPPEAPLDADFWNMLTDTGAESGILLNHNFYPDAEA